MRRRDQAIIGGPVMTRMLSGDAIKTTIIKKAPPFEYSFFILVYCVPVLLFLSLVIALFPDVLPEVEHAEPNMCVSIWRHAERSCDNHQSSCAENLELYRKFCLSKKAVK